MAHAARTLLLSALVPLALLACDSGSAGTEHPMAQATELYTLTNLHPDPNQKRLYSVNYQLKALIPRCSKVDILSLDAEVIIFKVEETGMTYNYYFHDSLTETPEKHAERYFGAQCDKTAETMLSEEDIQGIKTGQAGVGMSKQGIIYALGYPPAHATPSLEGDVWKYWRNRFDTFNVEFQDDKVVNIRN